MNQRRDFILYILFGLLFVAVTILLKPLTGSLLLLLVPETVIHRMSASAQLMPRTLAVVPIRSQSE